MVLGCVALAGNLGGCSFSNVFGGSSKKVAFTNVSDASLNVRFFMENPSSDDKNAFLSDQKFQIDRGETAEYKLARNPNYDAEKETVVHINVQPVNPSWQSAGREYWLELLTHPPVTIVATGSANALEFTAGTGAIAVIPEKEITAGRFRHEVVSVPEDDAPKN